MLPDDDKAVDQQLQSGDSEAVSRVFPQVYGELRRLAHWQLRNERTGHTLDTGALVHETYLKMVDQPRVKWRDRAHFFRVASWSMRRILVDYARRYGAKRRGSGIAALPLDDKVAIAEQSEQVLALDEALERLAAVNLRLSQVVECRYFGGLSEAETAEALGVTPRTVQRDWNKARAWLVTELGG